MTSRLDQSLHSVNRRQDRHLCANRQILASLLTPLQQCSRHPLGMAEDGDQPQSHGGAGTHREVIGWRYRMAQGRIGGEGVSKGFEISHER